MALPTLPMLGWDKGALCTHLGGNRRGSSIPRAGQTPSSPSSVCPPLNPSDVHIAQPLWCWRSPEPPQYFHPLDPSHVHIPPNLSSVHIPQISLAFAQRVGCSTMGLAAGDLTTLGYLK